MGRNVRDTDSSLNAHFVTDISLQGHFVTGHFIKRTLSYTDSTIHGNLEILNNTTNKVRIVTPSENSYIRVIRNVCFLEIYVVPRIESCQCLSRKIFFTKKCIHIK